MYGNPDKNGWLNKIFWGDNLQVMSHLLLNYRGKIDLIYIDPPFDSKADYKKKISVKKQVILNDSSIFEEKQYGDIWTNDEYLQFMYERISLLWELLSDTGTLFLHCDWHKAHHLRMILDEIFGPDKFVNEIIWAYTSGGAGKKSFSRKHDNIYIYSKKNDYKFRPQMTKRIVDKSKGYDPRIEYFIDEATGQSYRLNLMTDVWNDLGIISPNGFERTDYPTQKPEDLLRRIIETSTDEGDIILDCFMGSGTTQAVALKMNRKFIGADINLGAIQTATKRLNTILSDKKISLFESNFIGFEVYNVNNYDFFRNPIEARELLIEALGIQPFSQKKVFDGELDGRNVKIMPINRIATKADLKELIANLPYAVYDKKKDENPNTPVDYVTLVCMGHEPDLSAAFKHEVSAFKIDVQVFDILSEKKDFIFKREAQAEVKINKDELVIESFYPMNLMQKLSLQKENVENYKQLVESIMIDWDYDGEILKPTVIDIPDKNDFVKGKYSIPTNHGKIKVKITDLLSESLEIEVD